MNPAPHELPHEAPGRYLNVVDLEATCWRGEPPAGQIGEIIEIGITTVDTLERTRSAKRSILVRPTRSRVSPFCTELTTLTQPQVDGGVSFEAACTMLRREYRSDSRPWVSWGDYDRKMFMGQCERTGVPYPFGSSHTNLKIPFSRTQGTRRRFGLAEALERIAHPLEGTHHRGVDDAWNTAALLLYVLEVGGLEALAPEPSP